MKEPLWEKCPKCMIHFLDEPALGYAFSTVGIERGKSDYQMAEAYFSYYHENGHGK